MPSFLIIPCISHELFRAARIKKPHKENHTRGGVPLHAAQMPQSFAIIAPSCHNVKKILKTSSQNPTIIS
jgi:hypothetical protein